MSLLLHFLVFKTYYQNLFSEYVDLNKSVPFALCDHNKEREPTKEEVQEPISGVEKFSKTLF